MNIGPCRWCAHCYSSQIVRNIVSNPKFKLIKFGCPFIHCKHADRNIFLAKKWPAFCWFSLFDVVAGAFAVFVVIFFVHSALFMFYFWILFFSAFFDSLAIAWKEMAKFRTREREKDISQWNKADSLGQSFEIYQKKYQGIAPTTNGIGVESFWQESWSHFLRNHTHRSTSTAPNRLKKKRTKKT